MKNVDITMILDRSGSMGSMTGQVIKSFNDFLLEQKAVEGKAAISLIQFDDQYEINYVAVDIQDAKDLNGDTYQPRGMTALLDAIGRTIVSIKERRSTSEQTDDVVVVITTDGMENASEEYTRRQIREMIKECEDDLGWKFIYLAADEASFEQYGDFGMKQGRSIKMGRGGDAYDHASKLMSAKLGLYRHGGNEDDLDFTDKEREEADNLDQG
jgi:uncharacterized protein YegL